MTLNKLRYAVELLSKLPAAFADIAFTLGYIADPIDGQPVVVALDFSAHELDQQQRRLVKQHFGPLVAVGDPGWKRLRGRSADGLIECEIYGAVQCEIKTSHKVKRPLLDYQRKAKSKELDRLTQELSSGEVESQRHDYDCTVKF